MTPEHLYEQAKAHMAQGQPIMAIADLTRAIALNEDYAEAYRLRGQLLLEMGDVANAKKDAACYMAKTQTNVNGTFSAEGKNKKCGKK